MPGTFLPNDTYNKFRSGNLLGPLFKEFENTFAPPESLNELLAEFDHDKLIQEVSSGIGGVASAVGGAVQDVGQAVGGVVEDVSQFGQDITQSGGGVTGLAGAAAGRAADIIAPPPRPAPRPQPRPPPVINPATGRIPGPLNDQSTVPPRQPQAAPRPAPPSQLDASSPAAFVRSIGPAVAQVAREFGLPADIMTAIAANETGWGKHIAGGNLFGIKGEGTGPVNTWEVVNGQRVNVQDSFRAYDTVLDSVRDFGRFLHENPRYANALKIAEQGDSTGFVRAVHAAGYATDPAWSDKVLNIAGTVRELGGGVLDTVAQSGGVPGAVATGMLVAGNWQDIALEHLNKPYIWGSGSGAGGRGTQDIDPKTGLPRGFDCLIAGTLVTTDRGPVPIEQVMPGDMALTSVGYRPVLGAWLAGSREVWRLQLIDGSTITGTASHRVMTTSGWKELSTLTNSDILLTCSQKLSSSRACVTTATPNPLAHPFATTFSGQGILYTERFGGQRRGRFQRASRSTTSTTTRSITTSPTLSAFHAPGIDPNRPMHGVILNDAVATVERYSQRRGARGTRRTGGFVLAAAMRPGVERPDWIAARWSAKNAAPESGRLPSDALSIAGIPVRPKSVCESAGRVFKRPTPIGALSYALSVAKQSTRQTTVNSSIAVGHALNKCVGVSGKPTPAGRAFTYDLEVEGQHEFFANGVLVANCSGFVSFVMQEAFGLDLTAFTGSAYTETQAISAQDARPGDIVFYNMNNPDPRVQHMAIYMGDGKIIQAGGGAGKGVNIARVNSVGTPEFRRAAGAQAPKARQAVGGILSAAPTEPQQQMARVGEASPLLPTQPPKPPEPQEPEPSALDRLLADFSSTASEGLNAFSEFGQDVLAPTVTNAMSTAQNLARLPATVQSAVQEAADQGVASLGDAVGDVGQFVSGAVQDVGEAVGQANIPLPGGGQVPTSALRPGAEAVGSAVAETARRLPSQAADARETVRGAVAPAVEAIQPALDVKAENFPSVLDERHPIRQGDRLSTLMLKKDRTPAEQQELETLTFMVGGMAGMGGPLGGARAAGQAAKAATEAGELAAKPNAVEQLLDTGLEVPGRPPPSGPAQILGPRGELLSTVGEQSGVAGVARTAEGAAQLGEITAATRARMPNVTKLGDDMPDVVASIARVADENPEFIDIYRRGTVSHRELIDDLAPRLGMTADDFLKTQPGRAFNEAELLALRSAVVHKQRELVDLTRSVADRGGIGALSDAEKANMIGLLTDAARLQAVGRGAASTAGRALNQQKIVIDRTMAEAITSGNEAKAAAEALRKATAKQQRAATKATDLENKLMDRPLSKTERTDLQKAMAEERAAQREIAQAQRRAERAAQTEAKTTERQQQQAAKALEALGGKEVTEDVLRRFMELQQSGDPMAVTKFLRGLQKPTFWDRVGILRYGSMLSSTATHMVNATSNAINAGLDLALKPLAVGMDVGRATITGGERTMYLAELGPQARGMLEGAVTGLKQGITVMRTGINPLDAGKIELRQTRLGSGSEALDFIAEAPMRGLMFGDLFFRGMARGGHTRSLAVRHATKEGYRGAARDQRAQEIVENITDFPELLVKAEEMAARAVFQESRGLTASLSSTRRRTGFVGNLVVPFLKTLVNITAQGVEMSPAGFLRAIREGRKGNVTEATEAAARGSFGSAVMLYAFSQAEQGLLTAGYPDDPTVRSTLPSGWREWSVLIPHEDGTVTAIGYEQLGPIAYPLMAGALLGDASRKRELELSPEFLARTVFQLGKFLTDQNFARGLNDLFKAQDDPDRYAENFAEGLATQFVPYGALQRQINRAKGDASRDVQGVVEALLSSTAFTAGDLPERTNRLGDPVQPGQTGIAAFVSPVRYDIIRDDPVLAAYRDAQLGIPDAPSSITQLGVSVELTREEQEQYKQLAGQALKDYLTERVQTAEWNQRSRESRRQYLESAQGFIRGFARDEILKQIGNERIREAAEQEREERSGAPPPIVPVGSAPPPRVR